MFWIRPKAVLHDKIKNILLIKLERVGDLVLSTPAIRAVKQRFPGCRLSIIVNKYTKGILENDPYLDEVIVYDNRCDHRSLSQKLHFIKGLKSKKFDLAIDLSTRDFFFLPVFLLSFSGAKITMGLDNYGRGFLFNIKVKPFSKPIHLVKEVLNIVSPLDISIDDIQPRLFVSDENKRYVQNLLSQAGIGESELLVCIHPAGVYETKYWPREGYIELARHIIEKHKGKVIFVGSQSERKLAEEISEPFKEGTVNLADRTSLGQLLVLIGRCDLFIGNNSGPLNIALGFDKPTISFIGPSIPERWSPQGEKNIVFRADLPCSPCELGLCFRKDLACMKEIKTEDVLEGVDRLLKEVRFGV